MKAECRTVVTKIASRCNLNCTYCYMYNMGDNSFKMQPKFMSIETINNFMDRVCEHCETHGIEHFDFVIHGGEPLLCEKELIRYFVERARSILNPQVYTDFYLQTNGILIDEEWIALFEELQLNVGISLDGSKEINDVSRVYHSGKGSYDDVVKGIKLVQTNEYLASTFGLLTVVNIDADPEQLYHSFLELGVRSFDFLLPDHNFDKPPKRTNNDPLNTDYGDWLIKIFDLWYANKEGIYIRFFDTIIRLIFGQETGGDNLGIVNNDVLVLETNGEYEAVDALKICGESFTKTGVNTNSHSIDDALATDLAKTYYLSHEYLSPKCLGCPVREICGSGYIPHRYSKEAGFNNPSVFCMDLLKVITHIQNTIIEDFPQAIRDQTEIVPLLFEEAKAILDANVSKIERQEYTEFIENF